MDALVAVRAADRLAADLLTAVAEVAAERPTVTHTGAETELALRSRGRDLVVLDPDVVDPSAARPLVDDGGPVLVAWLGVASSTRAAQLLEAGADEVLNPSMVAVELVARLRRVVARRGAVAAAQPAELGDLRVDASLRAAHWGERPLSLTPREVEVLQVLVAAGGQTVTRELVYRLVWRWAMPRGDRTVDVNVKRLRDKLAAAAVPVEVVTQPGVGYRLSVADRHAVVTGL